jgi:tetratricopeptide (TPR) repeat protein
MTPSNAARFVAAFATFLCTPFGIAFDPRSTIVAEHSQLKVGKEPATMTDDRFDEWMADLEERAQRGDPAAVLNEINASPPLELDPYELGRIRGLAVCCLEWCGMDPLAKGLTEEVCDGDPAAAVSAGIECSEMGELEYAEEILRTMCDRWPDSVYPPLNLGVVLQKQHEHHRAIEQFDKTLAIESEFAPALLERARSFRELEACTKTPAVRIASTST